MQVSSRCILRLSSFGASLHSLSSPTYFHTSQFPLSSSEVGTRTGIPSFYVAFVVAPLASNASELIASYSYALKKTPKSISISLQALQGAACMNNTFCLSIFMALIYFQVQRLIFVQGTCSHSLVYMKRTYHLFLFGLTFPSLFVFQCQSLVVCIRRFQMPLSLFCCSSLFTTRQQGLAWEFSAETIAIVLCQVGVAIASTFENQTLFSACLVFMLYPFCLALVATLEAAGFD